MFNPQCTTDVRNQHLLLMSPHLFPPRIVSFSTSSAPTLSWATSSWVWAASDPARSLCCPGAAAWRCWPAARPAWKSRWCWGRRRKRAHWLGCSLWLRRAAGGWRSSPAGWCLPSAPPVLLWMIRKRQESTLARWVKSVPRDVVEDLNTVKRNWCIAEIHGLDPL